MKKITLCIMLIMSVSSFAQSNTPKKLAEGIRILNTAKSIEDYNKAFDTFSVLRREMNSDSHWIAYYYLGYSAYKQAETLLAKNSNAEVNSFLSMATKATLSASFNVDNAESNALLGHIELLTLQYKGEKPNKENTIEAKKYLEKAEKLEPNNPRVLLLKAKIMAMLPNEEGGNKAEAKAMFQNIVQMKTNNLHNMPNWGHKEAKEYLINL